MPDGADRLDGADGADRADRGTGASRGTALAATAADPSREAQAPVHRPASPWLNPPPPGSPVQSWVVLALDGEAAPFLADLSRDDGGERTTQLVVVCRASATAVVSIPQWVTLVPVPDQDSAGLAQARQLGLERAVGDVVHLVTTAELAAGESHGATDWARLLIEAGAGRPRGRTESAP